MRSVGNYDLPAFLQRIKDVACFRHLPRLVSVQFVGCRGVRGNIRVFEHTPRLQRIFFYHSQVSQSHI